MINTEEKNFEETANDNNEQNNEKDLEKNKKLGKKNKKDPTDKKKFIIIVCASDYLVKLPKGIKTTLFGETFDIHAHRKIMDVTNKLGINVRFLSADVFDKDLNNKNHDLASKVAPDDIIAIVSPFVFLTPSCVIEEAIRKILSKKDTISIIGDKSDYIAAFCLGRSINGDTDIDSFENFLLSTQKSGAIYTHDRFMENEKASPSSRMDYYSKIEEYRNEFLDHVIMSGVDIENRDGVVISPSCVVRTGTKILPNTQIYDSTLIKPDCVIGPNTVIINSQIGEKSTVENSKISDSVLDYNVTVESNSVLKNNCQIESGVKICSGCSIENSNIGAKTTIYQNSVLIETKTGMETVIGIGTITVKSVNRTEKSKTYQCRIGNHAIIGCNSTLIEPIEIGNNALIAAGSVITDSVSDNAFAIAREFQETKENKAKKRKRF